MRYCMGSRHTCREAMFSGERFCTSVSLRLSASNRPIGCLATPVAITLQRSQKLLVHVMEQKLPQVKTSALIYTYLCRLFLRSAHR